MSDQTYGVLLGASAATAFWVVAALLLLRGLDRTWRMRLDRERAARPRHSHVRPRRRPYDVEHRR